jgi:hypothetical protein
MDHQPPQQAFHPQIEQKKTFPCRIKDLKLLI